MKKIVLIVCMVMVAMTAGAVVKPGVEVLRDGGFAQLQGKRVGLVTNPSGIDNNLKSRQARGAVRPRARRARQCPCR